MNTNTIEIINPDYSADQDPNRANETSLILEPTQNQKEETDLIIIKKSFNIKGTQYTYEGPDHPYVQDLLDLLRVKEEQPLPIRSIERIRVFVKSIERWFEDKCTFCSGQFVISFYYTITVIFYLILYFVYLSEVLSFFDDPVVQKSSARSLVSSRLPEYGLLFLMINLINIPLRNNALQLFFFLAGVLMPSFIALIYYINVFRSQSEPNYDVSVLMPLFTLSSAWLNSIIINFMSSWIDNILNRFVSMIFQCGWCLLVVYLIGFQILVYIMTSQTLLFVNVLNYVVTSIYTPFLIILICSWLLIKARLFDWPAGVIMSSLDRIKEMLVKKYLEAFKNQVGSSCFHRNLDLVIPYLIGIAYLISEIWLFVVLASELQEEKKNSAFITILGIQLAIIPFHLIIGVFISISDRPPGQTYLLVPLLIGAPTIFGFVKLGNYLSSVNAHTAIWQIVQIFPSLFQIFWLTQTLVGLERRKIYLYFLGFMCYFLAVPVGILLPLYYVLSISSLLVASYVLLIMGASILAIILVTFVIRALMATWKIKEIASSDYPEFSEFAYHNLTDYAFYINALCFLFSFLVISYFFWNIFDENSTTATETESGTLFALIIIHPILFYLINRALSYRSLWLDEELSAPGSDNFERFEQQRDQERVKLLSQQNKIVQFGAALPFLVFVPFGFVQSNLQMRTMFLGLGFGVPLAFLFFKILLTIKNSNEEFQNFFQPIISSASWCCVLFPFGVAVPILAVYIENNQEDFQTFAQLAVAFGIFICILGVTLTALFFSLLLNREEFERKKREVLKHVMEVLTSKAVLNDLSVVSHLYVKFYKLAVKEYAGLKYLQAGLQRRKEQAARRASIATQLITALRRGEPVYVVPYGGPILDYDHQLVSAATYAEYQRYMAKLSTEQKVEEPSVYWKLLLDCICCRCGLEEESMVQKMKENEILGLKDMLILDEKARRNISQFMPNFSRIRVDEEKVSLIEKYEVDQRNLVILEKKQYKNIEDLLSSKTDGLREIAKREITEKGRSKVKSTEFYRSMIQSPNYVAEFMHEVFMEFANEDEGSAPSICYNDLMEFCRLTELHFTLLEYKRFASQVWLHQTHTLTETDFASLLKNSLKQFNGDPFENLKNLVIDQIYPTLIVHSKSLMYNLKERNRAMLKSLQDDRSKNPFMFTNFNNNSIVRVEQTSGEHISSELKKKKKNLFQPAVNPEERALQVVFEKSRKQREIERLQKQQEIEKKYETFLPWYKRCCYGCARFWRKIFCEYPKACWEKLFGSFKREPVQKPIQKVFEGERLRMPDWERIVAPLVINTMLDAADAYDEQKQKLSDPIKLRASFSNVQAIFTKLLEIYSLAALAFTPSVGWFGSNFDGASTVSGQAFYDSFEFYFYLSFGLSVLYAILGRSSLGHVQNNTLGLDESGNVARFPHSQFLLTKLVTLIGGFFMLIMKTYIDSFVCNYKVKPYVLIRDTSIECLSDTHSVYVGLAMIGVVIYYPLSTYLLPTFQYSDHSLDLKYKSSYVIVFVQVKLVILAVNTLFQTFENAILYQLIVGLALMVLTLILHFRIRPCLIVWFNIIDELMISLVIWVYFGAILILLTGNWIVGVVITGTGFFVVGTVISIFLYREVLENSKPIIKVYNEGSEEMKISIELSKQKGVVDFHKLGLEKKKEQMQVQLKSKPPVSRVFGQRSELNQVDRPIIIHNDPVPELEHIKEEINLEQVERGKSVIHKKIV